MGKRLFVGNLPYKVTEDELRAVFSEIGEVADVHIVLDRETGRPRGFAFVSYTTDENAAKAASTLNGRDLGGRPLAVNEARDRGAPPPRASGGPPRGGGGDRSGGGAPRPPRPARPPQDMPPMEEYKETAARPRMKKRKQGGGDSEGRRDFRRRLEEEEERGGSGSWRQWLDDDD